jgi:hypothetical protein
VKTNAWQPLVDQATFDRAQDRFLRQTRYRSGDELLAGLQRLWASKGTVSERLVNQAPDLPSLAAFVGRFGSLTEALARIGFQSRRSEAMLVRRRTFTMRQDLIRKIISAATAKITVMQRDGHFRPRLRLPNHSLVSVELLRLVRNKKGELRWAFNAHRRERDFLTLIARLNEQNNGFHDFFIVPDLRKWTRCTVREHGDKLLERGRQLISLGDFLQLAKAVGKRVMQP